MFVAVMALEEVLLLGAATADWVEVAVVAVLQLAHEEVAGIDLSVNADLGVGHQLLLSPALPQTTPPSKTQSYLFLILGASVDQLAVAPHVTIFKGLLLLNGGLVFTLHIPHALSDLPHLEPLL